MTGDPVTFSPADDGVGIIRMDDGKANALSFATMEAFHSALDQALSADVGAVVVTGRAGRFSAGFDLSVMNQGLGQAINMVNVGGDLMVRLLTFDRPVVAACTGHALAGGAIMLMSADVRIGVEGDFKIGLNETSIGMTVPNWVVMLAQHRLSPVHLQRATIGATIYGPQGAAEAGFLDWTVPDSELESAAVAEAGRLAALDRAAVLGTRALVRGGVLERIEAQLQTDRKAAAELVD